MDPQALRQLALDLSSDDLSVSRDARRKLQAFLTPSQIVDLLADPATAPALQTLLSEVETTGNADVYRLVGASLTELFLIPSAARKRVLFAPSAIFLLQFVVHTAAVADIAIASSTQKCLQRIMLNTPPDSAEAAVVGRLLDAEFHNDRVVRLLECDKPESTEDAGVCLFLEKATTLLPYLFTAAESGFASDPLLRANFIVTSAVACRTVAMPDGLRGTFLEVLRTRRDPFLFNFVCRFWSIVLGRSERNGSRYAAACVAAALPIVDASERDEDATHGSFEVLGAAATTRAGWDAVTAGLRCTAIQARLCSPSSSLRLDALGLLLSMLSSTHVAASFFTKDLLLDAWQTRTTPVDEVRYVLWSVVVKALGIPDLEKILAAVCASFLCSGAHEESIPVRAMKLQAAAHLIKHPTLPENVLTRLRQYVMRGLYPVGSGGVSLMTKD